jgi:hypothetical protein
MATNVIGFARTETMSTKLALEQLAAGPATTWWRS